MQGSNKLIITPIHLTAIYSILLCEMWFEMVIQKQTYMHFEVSAIVFIRNVWQ